MEEMNNAGTEPEQKQVDADTAADAQQGKTFTQEQVNEIVSERLRKQKETEEKRLKQEIDVKTAELTARASKLDCKEFLMNNNYPMELLDIIETSDVKAFKDKVEKTCEVFKASKKVAPLANLEGTGYINAISEGFATTKHTPKGNIY